MSRLRFDADSGCYVGAALEVSGGTMLRRIRALTDAGIERGVDPVEAAERAWLAALEEASWKAGADGVTVRSPEQDVAAPGREAEHQ